MSVLFRWVLSSYIIFCAYRQLLAVIAIIVGITSIIIVVINPILIFIHIPIIFVIVPSTLSTPCNTFLRQETSWGSSYDSHSVCYIHFNLLGFTLFMLLGTCLMRQETSWGSSNYFLSVCYIYTLELCVFILIYAPADLSETSCCQEN